MNADWVPETKDGTNFLAKGGLQAVDDALTAVAVLVGSRDDHDANMLWLAYISSTMEEDIKYLALSKDHLWLSSALLHRPTAKHESQLSCRRKPFRLAAIS